MRVGVLQLTTTEKDDIPWTSNLVGRGLIEYDGAPTWASC